MALLSEFFRGYAVLAKGTQHMVDELVRPLLIATLDQGGQFGFVEPDAAATRADINHDAIVIEFTQGTTAVEARQGALGI